MRQNMRRSAVVPLLAAAVLLVASLVLDGPNANAPNPRLFATGGEPPVGWTPDLLLPGNLNPREQRSPYKPAVAVQGSVVHVAWDALWGGIGSNVYYARSLDNGVAWDDGAGNVNQARRMSLLEDPRWGHAGGPQLAVNGPVVHIIWGESTGSSIDPVSIVYRRSADNGVTWSEERVLNDVDPDRAHPGYLAVDGDDVHVAWTEARQGTVENQVYYRRSVDGGLAWGPIVKLSSRASGWYSVSDIAASNGSVFVVGSEDSGRDWLLWRSLDGGATWDDGQGNIGQDGLLVDFNLSVDHPSGVSIASGGATVHLAWTRAIHHYEPWGYAPFYQLWYKRSKDMGATWTEPILLVDHTDVPLSDARLDPGCDALYDEKFGLLGQDTCGHAADFSDIVTSGRAVHLVWGDMRFPYPNSTRTHAEIMYKSSMDGGENWSADVRLTDAPMVSGFPALALEGGTLHVVWTDFRDWDPANNVTGHVYYKRNPDDLPPSAPTMLPAQLVGPTLEDVRLAWLPSADDGGGERDVVAYEVWAGDAYDPTGASYTRLATLPPGATSNLHAGAGVGDPFNHFYQVRVIDAGNRTAMAAQQAGKFTRFLAAGENLLSVPLEQAGWNLGAVLQTVPWTRARAYLNDGGSGLWLSSVVGKSGPTLTTLDLQLAVWVNVSTDAWWAVAGLVPSSTQMSLREGWNLIGYPGLQPRAIGDVLAGVSCRTVEGYAPVAPYYLRQLLASDSMEPGGGYWVWAREPALLSVEN